MISLFLLTACGPGSLEFNDEIRNLRSAWALEAASGGERGLLLSTSSLPCTTTPPDDPTQVLLETQEISHARSREGSLILWVQLADPPATGERNVTLSGYEVIEAERMWTDGLIANYRPTETMDYLTEATLELTSISKSRWTGHLRAEDPSLRADFQADICQSEEVFQILGLIGID